MTNEQLKKVFKLQEIAKNNFLKTRGKQELKAFYIN